MKNTKKQLNPIMLEVWKKLKNMGELEGLTDEQVLEKVVAVSEKLMERIKKKATSSYEG